MHYCWCISCVVSKVVAKQYTNYVWRKVIFCIVIVIVIKRGNGNVLTQSLIVIFSYKSAFDADNSSTWYDQVRLQEKISPGTHMSSQNSEKWAKNSINIYLWSWVLLISLFFIKHSNVMNDFLSTFSLYSFHIHLRKIRKIKILPSDFLSVLR